jgi:hypothetical protein
MLEVTEFQKSELIEKYNNREYTISKRSIRALERLEAIDKEGNLTESGINTVISEFQLPMQASALGIEMEEYLVDPISEYAEYNLAKYLEDKCISCVWAEGRDILLGIHACALNCLNKINTLGENDAITRYIEAQFTINKAMKNYIINEIAECRFESYMRAYKMVYKGICSIQDFVEIDERHMTCLYEEIMRKHRIAIAELLITDPYKYRKGWPDLTVLTDSSFKLVEVKHHDRLISSQIYTIPELLKIGIDITVGHIEYAKDSKIRLTTS